MSALRIAVNSGGILKLSGGSLLWSTRGRARTRTITTTYNATTTFFTSPSLNPNGVWSFGYMSLSFTGFAVYTESFITGAFYGWRKPGLGEPNMSGNAGSVTAFGVAPGQITLHPGPTTEPSCLRWTAPSDLTTISIAGQFYEGDVATVSGAVRRGSTVLFSVSGPGTFLITQTNILAGETIDVVAYGAYAFGNTPVRLEITATETITS